jgi:hypothetical protein
MNRIKILVPAQFHGGNMTLDTVLHHFVWISINTIICPTEHNLYQFLVNGDIFRHM